MKKRIPPITCIFLLLICSMIRLIQCHRSQSFADLHRYIMMKMERDKIPGMAACLVKDDRIAWFRGYGWADTDKKSPVTENTIFGTASLSKLVTAAAVMKLHEQGKLDIAEPVNRYLPFEVRQPNHPGIDITIEQVMSHMSSISNGPSLWRNFRCGPQGMDPIQWSREYFIPGGSFYDREGNFERRKPGEGFQYSNAGYGLLSGLIAFVSGLRFGQYCQNVLFDPLNMRDTSFDISDLDEKKCATLYSYHPSWDLEKDLVRPGADLARIEKEDLCTPLCHYTTPTPGAGDLYSSVLDLSRFMMMLMNRGIFKSVRILEESSIDKILGPHVDPSLLPQSFAEFGLGGYAMRLTNGETIWGHTGADPGISSLMLFNGETGIGAIVLANRYADIRDMIEWMFAEGFAQLWDRPLSAIHRGWKEYSRQSEKHKVVFHVRPKVLPAGSGIFVIGNHRYLGSWVSAGIPLEPKNDGSWEKTLFFNDSTECEFKITRGAWKKEAVNGNGTVPGNSTVFVVKDTVLNILVENWKDTWEEE